MVDSGCRPWYIVGAGHGKQWVQSHTNHNQNFEITALKNNSCRKNDTRDNTREDVKTVGAGHGRQLVQAMEDNGCRPWWIVGAEPY